VNFCGSPGTISCRVLFKLRRRSVKKVLCIVV
jgi:hypothetical protein